MQNRYGESASIFYRDASSDGTKSEYGKLIDEIEKRGLLYPVTVIDGVPVYDGAVSYPAILRAVENKLSARAETA